MRAELVPLEMDVPIDKAWGMTDRESETRLMPAHIGKPSEYEGHECRVAVRPFGGLVIVYGLDRQIPHPDDSRYDMVTWAIGNVKLVFTTEEWETLKEKTDTVIAAGRQNYEEAWLRDGQ
jgi:hypothetical protein